MAHSSRAASRMTAAAQQHQRGGLVATGCWSTSWAPRPAGSSARGTQPRIVYNLDRINRIMAGGPVIKIVTIRDTFAGVTGLILATHGASAGDRPAARHRPGARDGGRVGRRGDARIRDPHSQRRRLRRPGPGPPVRCRLPRQRRRQSGVQPGGDQRLETRSRSGGPCGLRVIATPGHTFTHLEMCSNTLQQQRRIGRPRASSPPCARWVTGYGQGFLVARPMGAPGVEVSTSTSDDDQTGRTQPPVSTRQPASAVDVSIPDGSRVLPVNHPVLLVLGRRAGS